MTDSAVIGASAVAVIAFASACAAPDASVAPESSAEMEAASFDRSSGSAPLYLVTLQDDVRDVRAVARELGIRGNFGIVNVREHAARGFDAVIPPSAFGWKPPAQ